MAKKRLDIGQLYQGVSEQPAWRRQTGQTDEVVNLRCDPLEGLRKRNSTDLVNRTGLLSSLNPYIISMRQFIIFIFDYQATGLGIIVYDRDAGGNVQVIAPYGWTYLNGAAFAEIDTTAAIDTLMILNRTITPTTGATPNYSVAGTVNQFSQLPDYTTVAAGTFYKVRLIENYDPSGYYLNVDPNSPTLPTGFQIDTNVRGWQQVPAPNDPDGHYNATTLPHRLIYDSAANTFTFEPCLWRDRMSGNKKTNKVMPWANVGLKTICFHKGRLFMMGRDAITAGASSPNQSIFNLFVGDVLNNVVDSDRISIDINLANIGTPQRSLSVGNDLFVNCQNGQLSFSANDQALTGTNGRYVQVGDHRTQDIPLASNGPEIVLVDQFGFVQLFRWINSLEGVQYQGSITEHVPTLLKNETVTGVYFINNTIFVTTASARVYVHERAAAGGQIIQLAWNKNIFYEKTVYMDAWKNYIYLTQKGTSTFHSILKYQHQKNTDSSEDFTPRLDRRQIATISQSDTSYSRYDPFANKTYITFEDSTPTTTTVQLVNVTDGIKLYPVSCAGSVAAFNGDLRGKVCHWGFIYDSYTVLSKIWPQADIRPTLSALVVFHKDSTNYTVEIYPPDYTPIVNEWNGPNLFSYKLNAKALDTGTSRWPAQGDGRFTNVRISCNDAGTMTISAVEFQAQTGSN